MENGRWSADVSGQCIQRKCPGAPEVAASRVKEPVTSSVGDGVTYNCLGDATFNLGLSTSTTYCLPNHYWTPKELTCQERRCPPPPYVEKADLIFLNNEVGGRAEYRCHPGHRFLNGLAQRSVTCSSQLTWSFPGHCYSGVCQAINATYVTVNTTAARYGTYVKITCPLYKHFSDYISSKVVLCLEDKTWDAASCNEVDHSCTQGSQWNDTNFTCTDIDCGTFPLVDNSLRSGASTLAGSSATLVCEGGRRHEDGHETKTIFCQNNGQWSENNMSCGYNRCPPLPVVANAVPDTRLALNNTRLTYTCLPGHEFTDTTTFNVFRCDGVTWDVPNIACQSIHCAPIDDSFYGSLSSSATLFGSTIEIACDEGYMINGSRFTNVTCMADKQWSDLPPPCQLVDCGIPPVIYTKKNHVTGPSFLHTTYASSAAYSCDEGYWFGRYKYRRDIMCTGNGSWQQYNLTCSKIQCQGVSQVNGRSAVSTGELPGSTVNISCDKDHHFSNKAQYVFAECGEDGKWSMEIPECLDNAGLYSADAAPTEAERSDKIGVIACLLVTLILVTLVAVDARTLIAHSRLLCANIKSWVTTK